ncbi:MAG TPA: flagellar basal body rod protein FlgB [Rhodanobacteraceae bacterium]|nr:flagellar basal body rod protein FlgB [Rhodanobacteraceae bacterium]
MSGPFQSIFGIHQQALEVWQQRANVLASNLANADTPNYQARDVDFRAVLAGATDDQLPLATTTPGQIGGASAEGIPVVWQAPMQPSMDGNTVDTQVNQSAFAANTVHYQASLTFINAEISRLRLAIGTDSSS